MARHVRGLARRAAPRRPRPDRRGERADRRNRRALPRAVPRDPSRRPRGVDPRRGDPRGRRGRQPAVLARPDARRHRHRSHRARAAGGADEVRRARRADPRDRLRGRRRRAHDHQLRQPADRGTAGDHAGGVHRRSGHVGDAPASGGPGRDARRVPRWARRGRTVHAGVPPHRTRRARVVVQRQRRRGPRRRRSAALRAGRDARHHPAQGGRGGDRVPGVPRQADRSPQPRHVRRAAGAVTRTSSPARAGRQRHLAGHRQLQAGERQPGTRCRQRADRAVLRAPAGGDP